MDPQGQRGRRAMALGAVVARARSLSQNLFALLVLGCTAMVFSLAYFAPVSYTGSDPQPSLLVSQAILEQGTIRLDAYMDRSDLDLRQWTVQSENGHFYYYWPVGPSALSTPAVWALNLLGLDMSVAAENNWTQNLLSAFLCAVVFALLYRLCRQYLSPWPSLLIATVSMLGSGLISTMGTALWNINFAVLFIVLLLLQLARLENRGVRAANPYWMGLLLFAAFSSRPSTSPFILVVLIYLLFKARGLFVRTAATAFALLTIYVGFNALEYGRPFQEYYSVVRVGIYSFPIGSVLYGLFLSPSRGLLVFSPFLALVAGTAICCYRGLSSRALFWSLLAWFALHIFLVSRSTRWWGGHAFGPRVLTEVLPALVLISILLWHHLSQQASPRVQRTVASGYLILGLVAVLINSYQGLYNTNTQRWNGYMLAPNIDRYPTYLLDWRYPQFLATGDTLCARNLEHMLQGLRSGAFDLDRLQFGESITYASGFAQIPPATSGPRPATDTASMEETAAASHHQHRTLLPVVLFSRENAAFVGWSKASTTYRWSECHEASIMFELDDLTATTGRYELLISSGAYGVQRAIVFLNGSHIGSVVVPSFGATKAEHRIPFDGSLLKADDLNEIRFVLPDAHPPAGRDARLLGLAFVGLQIEATGLDVP